MADHLLALSVNRKVNLCGTNTYPQPEYHPDRIMDEHDFMYCIEGSWTIMENGVEYNIGAGDLLFLAANSHHWGTSLCRVNTRNMFIHTSVDPQDRLRQSLTRQRINATTDGSSLYIPTLIHCANHSEIGELFRGIIAQYWSDRDDKERKMTLTLNLLINELSWLARNSVPAGEDWVTDLLHVLRDSTSRFYTLEEAAALVDMPPRSLSTRFRAITGKSINQYQMDLKLERARDMLIAGHSTVREVSDALGFCDQYYFSRVFRKKFGMPPKNMKHHDPRHNINREDMG